MFGSSFSRSLTLVALSSLTVPGIPSALGQAPYVNSTTSTPVPGTGHDYINLLNESVNPANGALSVRIEGPVPPERGFTLPSFLYRYDSNGQHVPQPLITFVNDPGGSGNPATSTPKVQSVSWGFDDGSNSQIIHLNFDYQPAPGAQCDVTTGYVYTDPFGAKHALHLQKADSIGGLGCTFFESGGATDNLYGGDTQYKAYIGPDRETVYITDAHGFVVHMLGSSLTEDRNGNFPSSAGRTYTTTSNSITFPGMSNPFTFSYGTAPFSFNVNAILLSDSSAAPGCASTFAAAQGQATGGWAAAGGNRIVSAITLPNGQQYQFQYEPVYGYLSKIIYPSGATVTYTWSANPQSEAVAFGAPQFNSQMPGVYCAYRYDGYAITKRVVSFDGINPAIEQDFNYLPPNWDPGTPERWTSKQTVVTTHDLLRPGQPSYQTIYDYSPIDDTPNQYMYTPWVGQIPVESKITYKDPSGNVLRTVMKSWADPFLLGAECTMLDNGQTSGVFYAYENTQQGLIDQVTDKKEYDFGQVASGTCTQPSGAAARETMTTYASFPVTPLYPTFQSIYDRPSSVKVYGNGVLAAETDYAYDEASTFAVSPSPNGHDETNYGPSSTAPRGNATTVTEKCFVGSTACTDAITKYTYDETGQVLSMMDPCGNATCSDMNVPGETHTTNYSYADSYTTLSNGQNVNYTPSGNTNAYVTRITHPTTVTSDFTGTHSVQHIENFTYDFNTGQLTVSKDENNQPSTYLYNDSFARPTLVSYPDGGQTTIAYNDSAPSPTLTTSRKIDTSGRLLTTVALMDGLGHVVQSELCEDGSACTQPIKTDTTFDGLGHVWKQSNPHRSAALSTDGTTTFFYDALGRTCLVVPPDATLPTGNTCPSTQPSDTVFTTYSGNTTTVTDEAGKKRQSTTDGLGRLSQVTEDPGGLGYVTNYGYDTLDNLTSVVQSGSRQRTFTYDSLSRLLTATNPESGTINYSYDANGNLSQRTAPAPNQTGTALLYTSNGYDALNRNIWKVYSDSEPSVQFEYDQSSVFSGVTVTNPIGRLTGENTGVSGTFPTGSAFFGYDPMGRVVSYFQCVLNCAGSGWAMYYTYDLLGDVTSYTNGLGTTFTQNFDNAGRLYQITSSLSDSAHPGTLATADSSVGFWPNGALRKMALGNGLYQTAVYNSRLQPCRVNVNSTSTYTPTLCGDSLPTVNVQDFNYGFNFGSSDNGNVASWLATGETGAQNFNRSYSHDSLNRLATMTATSDPTGCNGLSWTYDAWGNRTTQTTTAGACFQQPSTTFSANNQFPPPYGYDAAGNMTNDGSHIYFYDAENRIEQVDGTLGTCSTATACYVYDATGKRVQKTTGATQTNYLYDLSGNVINELDASYAPLTNYIYFGGALLAEYKSGTTYFVHQDHLGSTRLMTAMDKSIFESMDYLPFGEQVTGGSGTTRKFTAKDRDAESGNDYFGARYMGSSLGRFLSVDPAMESEILELPQTWNRYSYVYNRPLFATDPDGKCPPCVGALVGAAVEGGFDLGKQLWSNGGHLGDVKWGEVGANALGGFVAGGLAVATGGTSLYASAAVGDTVAGVTSTVVGGIVTRAAEGKDKDEVFSAGDVAEDALSGFVGGVGGHIAADSVHIPNEMKYPTGKDRMLRARMGRYNKRNAQIARAARTQIVRSTVVSSFTTHSTNGLLDWLRSYWLRLSAPIEVVTHRFVTCSYEGRDIQCTPAE